jgi:hypothetical protein
VCLILCSKEPQCVTEENLSYEEIPNKKVYLVVDHSGHVAKGVSLSARKLGSGFGSILRHGCTSGSFALCRPV